VEEEGEAMLAGMAVAVPRVVRALALPLYHPVVAEAVLRAHEPGVLSNLPDRPQQDQKRGLLQPARQVRPLCRRTFEQRAEFFDRCQLATLTVRPLGH
jgi:hypothetical protein